MAAKVEDALLTAAECARRTGLTVRALRIYETRGLIRPARTEKGWRLYGRQDLERLTAVVTLKSLGLGLAEIGQALKGTPDLAALFQTRIDAWRALIRQAQDGLALSQLALAAVQSPSSPSIEQLCEMVRSMKMTKMPQAFIDAVDTLYTPEEQERIVARKLAMAGDPTHGQAAWADLIIEIKAMIAAGTDPASPQAQAAAKRWHDLVRAFTGGDAAVEAKGKALWEQALDQDPGGRELPFGKAEWEFVGRAMQAAT
jgi:DNA-binding transcriptional MerR regulator